MRLLSRVRSVHSTTLSTAQTVSDTRIIGSGVVEKSDMQSRVEETLDKVRPAMRADGGDARVVACDEESGSVGIQMIGGCKGGPLSQLDFVYAIESLIKREVPEVREIVGVLGC